MSRRWIVVALSLLCSAASAQTGELTSEQAIRMALEKNPTLAATIGEVRRARAVVMRDEGLLDPRLLVDAGVTRTENPSLNRGAGVIVPLTEQALVGAEVHKKFAFGTDVGFRVQGTATRQSLTLNPAQPQLIELGPGYGISARLDVVQPLLRGSGRDVNLAQLDAARLQGTVATKARNRAAADLVRDVLNAYWEWWYAQQTVAIERTARDVATRQFEDAQARAKTGSVAPVDVLSFETQVASKDEAISAAVAQEEQRLAELSRLLGRAITRNSKPEAAPDMPAPIDVSFSRAMKSSPQIEELNAQIDLSARQARTSADTYRQRLDLDGYVQVQGLGDKSVPDALRQWVGTDAVSAHIGVTYELPLADRRRRGEATQALESVRIARENLRAGLLSLRADLRRTEAQERSARERVRLAERTARIAELQFEAEQRRFAIGASTSLQVVQAQEQVRQARLRLARAQADLTLAHVALLHLTGQLLTDGRLAIVDRR